jgi:hypothetical protein
VFTKIASKWVKFRVPLREHSRAISSYCNRQYNPCILSLPQEMISLLSLSPCRYLAGTEKLCYGALRHREELFQRLVQRLAERFSHRATYERFSHRATLPAVIVSSIQSTSCSDKPQEQRYPLAYLQNSLSEEFLKSSWYLYNVSPQAHQKWHDRSSEAYPRIQ